MRFIRRGFQKQSQLSASDFSDGVSAPLASLLHPQRVIAGYIAIGGEIDIASLLELASVKGCRIALPRIETRDAGIEFRAWRPGSELEIAPFGFRQPLASSQALSPDIILTPLLGFDRCLNRLGQGAGHYDRAFSLHPTAIRVGIAYSVQEVSAIAVDPWDVPLDAVLTEREWITLPGGRI